jgi:hypothetical protein
MLCSDAMGRITRALRPTLLPVRPGPPWSALRRPLRLVAGGLATAGLVAGAAWLAHAALGADRSPWPARLVDTVVELLRAAWIP